MTESVGFFKRMRRSSKSSKKSPLTADTPSEPIQHSSSSPASPSSPPEAATTTAAVSGDTSSNRQSVEVINTMDEELSRMRSELSRASIMQDKREMEAARASADLQRCKEELARMSAVKMEADNSNRKLQAEVSSMEREKARLSTEMDRLKEDLQRTKEKLAEKKRAVADLKTKLQKAEEEKEEAQKSATAREQTWRTIRQDVSNRRDDAVRDVCKLRRENEKLKSRITKLKAEKSNILYGLWEHKQKEKQKTRSPATARRHAHTTDLPDTIIRPSREDGQLQAKVLSLELQLFRNARLVELLLDVLQAHDPQFSVQERQDLTAAFADAGSIPDLLSRKVKFM